MRIRRRGFTLVEVMVTMAIMAIVSAISFPIARNMYLSVRLDAAGDSIRSSWADGQSHAMNEALPYRFSYIPGTGKYRLAPDSDDYWSGGEPPQNDKGTDGPVVLAGRLPKGVFFQTNGSPAVAVDDDSDEDSPSSDASHEHGAIGSYQKLLVFLPDGTATVFSPNGSPSDDNYAEITLKLDEIPALIVSLRGLTGVVSSRRESH